MSGLSFRPTTRDERQLLVFWVAAAASAVILRPLFVVVAPFLRPCVFRSLTGIPCPTCGTTRCAMAMFDLDLAAAFASNPLAAAAGLVFIVGGAVAFVWLVARWPVPALELRWSHRWTAAVVAIVTLNWIYLIFRL
jgi:hypothetical protein